LFQLLILIFVLFMNKLIVFVLALVPLMLQAQPIYAPATQTEVDAGTLRSKFVSPLTLGNWSGLVASTGLTNVNSPPFPKGILLSTNSMISFRGAQASEPVFDTFEGQRFSQTTNLGLSTSGHWWTMKIDGGSNPNGLSLANGRFEKTNASQTEVIMGGISNLVTGEEFTKIAGTVNFTDYNAAGFDQAQAAVAIVLADEFPGYTNDATWFHIVISYDAITFGRKLDTTMYRHEYPALLDFRTGTYPFNINFVSNTCVGFVGPYPFHFNSSDLYQYAGKGSGKIWTVWEVGGANTNNVRMSYGRAEMGWVDGLLLPFGNEAIKLDTNGLLTSITVPTEVYDATGWNGDMTVPTKDSLRDKIETLTGVPAGNTTEVQFNNAGVFGASTNFTFSKGGSGNTPKITLGGLGDTAQNIGLVVRSSTKTNTYGDWGIHSAGNSMNFYIDNGTISYLLFTTLGRKRLTAEGTNNTDLGSHLIPFSTNYSQVTRVKEVVQIDGAGGAGPAGTIIMGHTNGVQTHTIAASPYSSMNITNRYGLVHSNAATVMVADANITQDWTFTNAMGQASSLILTNIIDGQRPMNVVCLADGTARVLTIIPHLGYHVVNMDDTNAVVATSMAITVAIGQGIEISAQPRNVFGSNRVAIATRQFKY
jgi:acetolactate synthase regulatory subunit